MHSVHALCAGAETLITELYTPDIADTIHSAIKKEALSQCATAVMVSVPKVREEYHENDMIAALPPSMPSWTSS